MQCTKDNHPKCYFADVLAPLPRQVTRDLLPLGQCMACNSAGLQCTFQGNGGSEVAGETTERWSSPATVFLVDKSGLSCEPYAMPIETARISVAKDMILAPKGDLVVKVSRTMWASQLIPDSPAPDQEHIDGI